jgi:ribose/xylose/arabinose/galactoside ABC-type transport system permease subunit
VCKLGKNSVVISRYGIFIFLVLLSFFFAFTTRNHVFATLENLSNVARQTSINTILAVGLTFVIITGGIDLSVGSVVALAGVLSMMFLLSGLPWVERFGVKISPLVAVLISMVIASTLGALLGTFNGFVITRFRVAPFVATLAVMTIARGLAYVVCNGEPVGPLPQSVVEFGSCEIPYIGLPNLVLIAVVVAIIGHIVLSRTNFGRYVYAIGGNEEAARLSGINVSYVKCQVYALCGFLAGLSGMLLAARLGSGDPKSGMMFELNAIAAVVLGGTSLSGGTGTILGTLLGALVIGVLDNGLSLLHGSSFYQMVTKGFVILVAVILDQLVRKS